MANAIDISTALDAIGQLPGSILVRTETQWIALPPGPVGWVLFIDANGVIKWENPTIVCPPV